MKQFLLLFIISLAALFSSCRPQVLSDEAGQTILVPGGSYQDVSVAELEGMLDSKDFIFVNVHIPFEGDIPETDMTIPFNQIEQNISILPPNKDAKIVLYCRGGNMSSQAARDLVELGYTNVSNLSGGFNAWKASGYKMAGD